MVKEAEIVADDVAPAIATAAENVDGAKVEEVGELPQAATTGSIFEENENQEHGAESSDAIAENKEEQTFINGGDVTAEAEAGAAPEITTSVDEKIMGQEDEKVAEKEQSSAV